MFNKTILLVVNTGFVARALLRSEFLPLIKKQFQKVVVLVPAQKIKEWPREFEKDNLVMDEIRHQPDSLCQKKFFALLKFSIPTKTVKTKLMRNLFWQKGFKLTSWLLFFWPVFISWYLSRFKAWRRFLRRLYSSVRVDEQCLTLLKEQRPDIVFANYSQIWGNNFNQKLFRAAKKLKILTVGNIETWDQLDSKLFITEQTDFLTVPNEVVKKEALKIGDFQEEKIKVVGLPCFDFYSKKQTLLLPREDFFWQLGADPKKKLVLFAGGLPSLGVDYDYFFSYFTKMMKHKLPDIQFYLRPHPKYYFTHDLIDRYQNTPGLIFEKKLEEQTGKNFDLTEKDNQLLFNLFYYADVVICIFSTVLIEACLMQKPVITLGYYGPGERGYYYRPERDLERGHLKYAFRREFAKIARNDQELFGYTKAYLDNPLLQSRERAETAKEQAFFTDGTSAAFLAETIKEIAQSQNAGLNQ